jgi:hypothetical protein
VLTVTKFYDYNIRSYNMPTPEELQPISLDDQERMFLRRQSRYGLDVTGKHADNKVVDEHHLLRDTEGRPLKGFFLIEGAFYTEDIVIKNAATGIELKKATRDPGTMELNLEADPDYYCAEVSVTVGELTGREAAYVIVSIKDFPKEALVSYQVVGGQFVTSRSIMQKIVENKECSDVCFDEIHHKPASYPAQPALIDMDKTYNWKYMINVVRDLQRSLELSHAPAYLKLTKKVCALIKKALTPKPTLWKSSEVSGLFKASTLDAYPSDEHVSKSDVLLMLARYNTDQFKTLGATAVTYDSKVISGAGVITVKLSKLNTAAAPMVAIVYLTYTTNDPLIIAVSSTSATFTNTKTIVIDPANLGNLGTVIYKNLKGDPVTPVPAVLLKDVKEISVIETASQQEILINKENQLGANLT